jgi:putative endopeptidase
MRFFLALSLVGSSALLAGCSPSKSSQPAASAAAPEPSASGAAPASAEPSHVIEASLESVGLDPLALDRSVDPCSDFYQFSCGGWIEQTQIPADEPAWTRSFHEIRKRNELELQRILEEASQSKADPSTQKIGAFYAACMDESAADAAGAQPIAGLLAKVSSVKDQKSLTAFTTELHGLGIWPFFDISPVQDPKDASRWVANLDQGGLGLPDRDYYLRDDEASRKLLRVYLAHVERMLLLTGMPKARAQAGAADVLKIETALAKVSRTRVERRDPKNMFNRLERAQVAQAAPAFKWDSYFEKLGLAQLQGLNVTAPKFFEGLQPVLSGTSPAALQAYLEWHIVSSLARQLSKPFLDESFALEQALTGQAELRPRWRRCVAASDEALGDLIGQAYVRTSFAGASKQAAEGLVHAISASFRTDLASLSWMDDPTRTRAVDKLTAMAYLIGYPEQWKSYDFEVSRTAHVQNVLRARAFEIKRDLAKVGHPVDPKEWQMSPPTVNAYYDAQLNHMVFPAGILQPPFYDVKSGAPVNLGAIGMVVGHELTHGFDDEGSQYDAKGNLENWWSPEVSTRFKEKTSCVAKQYSSYEALPGLNVNGDLTLGENIADMGGVKLAFEAYRALRKDAPEKILAGGFTEDQQFFLAVGQAWCAKYRPEYERLMVQVNPHAPPRFRIRGPLSNLPQFAEAFTCSAGSAMQAENICSVW